MSNPIRYQDLVVPDSAITDLIAQLEKLNQTYDATLKKIGQEAIKVQASLEGISGSTESGRKAITNAAGDTDKLAQAYKRLQYAQSENGKELARVKVLLNEVNTLNKLNAKQARSMAGSYDDLSARYSKIKIELNKMAASADVTSERFETLQKEAYELYQEMIRLQEATGKHTLSVGNYGKALNGVNLGVQQILRELPNAAISANTFFLAISNNIPILIDQINLLRLQNAEAVKKGKQGIPVWKAITKSLLSWNTAMTVGVTLLTVYGADIIKWAKNILTGKEAIDQAAKSQELYKEALISAQKAEIQSITTSQVLYNIATDVNRSMEDRLSAAEKLIQDHPEYLNTFTAEEIAAGKAAGAHRELTNSLIEEARTRAYLSKIQENQTKIIDIQEGKLLEAQTKREEAARKLANAEAQAQKYREAGATEAATLYSQQAARFTREVKQLDKEIEGYTDEISALEDVNKRLEKGIKPTSLLGSGTTKKAREQQKKEFDYTREAQDARLALLREGMEKEIALSNIKYQREIEDYQKTLAEEKDLTQQNREDINNIIEDLAEKRLQEEERIRAKYRDLEAKEHEKAREQAAKEATKLYNERKKEIEDEHKLRLLEIDNLKVTEEEKTRLRTEAEIARIEKLLQLAESGIIEIGDTEREMLKLQLLKLKEELDNFEVTEEPKDLFEILGINITDRQKKGFTSALDYAMKSLEEAFQKTKEIADRRRSLADEQVEDAKRLLEAEMEARAEGYAHNVEMAQKELTNARQNQQKAIAEQQRAEKQQEAIRAASQAADLVTASAKIWAQLGNPALSIPAIALMWGSFAYAKLKAKELTETASYGDGTVELLKGGSHQSGNDIDLGVRQDGTRRRAEGGEYFAVINKRGSRRFGRYIPNVIHSLNDGTFADKYLNAYKRGEEMMIADVNKSTDLSELENNVRAIRDQGEKSMVVSNGVTIIKYKNVTRKIRV